LQQGCLQGPTRIIATALSALSSPQAGIRGQHEYPAQADYLYQDLSGDDRAVSMASSLPIYSLQEVSRHNTAKDLWIVIDKEVFDVTEFQAEHPGGERSELSIDVPRK
jgi:cytochrome b involved in lipid metabolism